MIIIFDSDEESAVNLKQELIEECEYNENSICIYNDTARQLLEIIKKDKLKTINVIFIELSLKSRLHGIDLAARIFELNKEIHIVFISSYGKLFIQQVFLDYYDFMPCAYLIKPVNKYFLKKTCEKIRHIDSLKEKIWIKTQWTTIALNADDIIYISTGDHSVYFHTKDNEYRSYTLLDKVTTSLTNSFVRCHKSFVVNKKYIRKVTASSILLEGNIIIPISRTYKYNTKQVLNEFVIA